MDNAVQLAQDFHSIKFLIKRIALKFSSVHGGEVDELYGEACLHFVQLHSRWDPARGAKLSTWMYRVLWRKLVSSRRKTLRCIKAENRVPEEEVIEHRNISPVRGLLDGLSARALEVVDLTLCPPPEVALEHRRALKRPISYRKAIAEFLLGMGWTPGEIGEAFQEISDTLNGY